MPDLDATHHDRTAQLLHDRGRSSSRWAGDSARVSVRVPKYAAAITLGAAACHAAPSVLILAALSRRLRAPIAGVGRPDHVAITFDDGPDRQWTPACLEALDRFGWRATFFMLGSMVEQDPGLAREVADAGHEIAVHGYEHRSHLLHTPAEVIADIRHAAALCAEQTGRAPRWLRPPYGHISAATLVGARRCNLRPVLWSVAGHEWRRDATAAQVAARAGRRLRGGDMVLLHDSDCTSPPGSARAALGALPALHEQLDEMGVTVGPVCDHGIRFRDRRRPDRDAHAAHQDVRHDV